MNFVQSVGFYIGGLYNKSMDRMILHCDMNAFFASVELLEHPELRDKPMAVCGNPKNRHGIIVAKNEIAKKAGVKTAETIWQAKRKCPDLRIVAPHHEKYAFYSKMINEIYYRYTDMVEPFSIDESWLDVTASLNLFGSGKDIADSIRNVVKSELGLTLSVGVSFNKIFAKMGSEYKKPDATTVITRENFKSILWPLPVGEMFFVGKGMETKLLSAGILTIRDLAAADRQFLCNMLGKHGAMVHDYANGLDNEPVAFAWEKRKIKSVGNGLTFKRDLTSREDIITAVTALSDTVAGRLRKYQMKAWGIKVDIKDPYFKSISRQKQLEVPTNLTDEISRAAQELILKSWNVNTKIRLLTVTGINLIDENDDQQLSLFLTDSEKREKAEKLERTIDEIRSKYGRKAVNFGQIIQNDIGIDLDELNEDD